LDLFNRNRQTEAALASEIDSERAFDWMPILDESLNEAGCDHVNVLTQCHRS